MQILSPAAGARPSAARRSFPAAPLATPCLKMVLLVLAALALISAAPAAAITADIDTPVNDIKIFKTDNFPTARPDLWDFRKYSDAISTTCTVYPGTGGARLLTVKHQAVPGITPDMLTWLFQTGLRKSSVRVGPTDISVWAGGIRHRAAALFQLWESVSMHHAPRLPNLMPTKHPPWHPSPTPTTRRPSAARVPSPTLSGCTRGEPTRWGPLPPPCRNRLMLQQTDSGNANLRSTPSAIRTHPPTLTPPLQPRHD
jgi:hypothetical protein